MPHELTGGAIPCVQPKREPGRAPKILHETNCGNRDATRRNREFRNKPEQTVGSVETKIVNFLPRLYTSRPRPQSTRPCRAAVNASSARFATPTLSKIRVRGFLTVRSRTSKRRAASL